MKRKFITNLGFLILLNVLIKPIYVFGIDRVVQNTLGSEVYGSFISLFNTALIFQILLDLGIENFIRREIAQNPNRLNRYLSNIVILKLLLAIPYTIICFALAFAMDISQSEVPLLLLILLNQFMASFILYIRANLGGLQLFKTEGIVSVLDRSLMILIVGFLLLHPLTRGKFNIFWFVIAQSISYFVVILISIWCLRGSVKNLTLELNLNLIRPIIKRLLPYATLVLLMGGYFRIDPIMLRMLLPNGTEQAGIFIHAFRILDFMSNYALLFPILLLPIFTKLIKDKKPLGDLLQLSVILLLVPSLAFIIPSIFYRVEIFKLLYKEYALLSANVFAWLTISYVGMCISYTFGALLTANKNLKQLNYMALSALTVSIVLNLILIPRYHVVGAAIANASAQLLTIIIHTLLVRYVFNSTLRFALILKLIVYAVLVVGISYGIYQLQMLWIYGLILSTLLGVLLGFILRLLKVRDIISIIKEKDISPV